MIQGQAKWWRLSEWSTYVVAVSGAGLALTTAYLFKQSVGDQAIFLLSTVPVAVAACLGGIGPGLLASIVSLGGLVFLFVSPTGSFAIANPQDRVIVGGFGLLWVFISLLCHIMRHATKRLAQDKRKVDEQRANLDSILGSITDGFYAVDGEWRITLVNTAFEKISNRTRADLIGSYLWDLFPDQAYYETKVKMTECLRRIQPFAGDVYDPKTKKWHQVRAFPKLDGLFVYLQDITDRKILDQSRERMLTAERKARSDAEAMNRMKDEFVATLSHELRTPLTTILGWTEILRRSTSMDAKSAEGLSVIERSARHQTQLIADLLDVSRITAGKLRLEISLSNLADTAFEAVELARPLAESKAVDIRVNVDGDHNFVKGDPARLFQIVSNLLSNAIKFTPSEGVIEVDVFARESSVICRVQDNGEGIDPDFLPFLFERFRQSDASSTRRHGGLGLGLAIVKQLVDLHHGKVRAFSDGKGKGSRFEVQLPMAEAPSIGILNPPASEDKMPSLENMSILVVDDDIGTRELLQKLLIDAGAMTHSVSSGILALEILETERFDVILSDISMPEMDGYQFMEAARAKFGTNGEVPAAIAITALSQSADYDRCAQVGFVQLLTKPVDQERLIRLAASLRTKRPAHLHTTDETPAS